MEPSPQLPKVLLMVKQDSHYELQTSSCTAGLQNSLILYKCNFIALELPSFLLPTFSGNHHSIIYFYKLILDTSRKWNNVVSVLL